MSIHGLPGTSDRRFKPFPYSQTPHEGAYGTRTTLQTGVFSSTRAHRGTHALHAAGSIGRFSGRYAGAVRARSCPIPGTSGSHFRRPTNG
jgi:hypothetical protein